MTDEFKYVGDGVYAMFDGFGIWLRTHRDDETHQIYLEPSVLSDVNKLFMRHVKKENSN